jgi:hypothetical protein
MPRVAASGTRNTTPKSRPSHAARDTYRRTGHGPVTSATATPHPCNGRRFGV